MNHPAAPLRTLLLLILTAGLIVIEPAPAHGEQVEQPATTQPPADPPEGGRSGGRGVSLPGAVRSEAEGFMPGASGAGRLIPTGSSVFAGCTWDRAEADEELIIGRPDIASINITGSTFDRPHWIIFCPQLVGFGAYTIFPVGERPPAAVIQDMVADAYAQTPVIAFNPITSPAGDEDIMVLYQLPTFLWVDVAAWNTTVSATVTLPLPGAAFSVTTTATPVIAYWSGGEDPTSCDGNDMQPWVRGVDDDAQPSNCQMVYRRFRQQHTVDLETTWEVFFTCSDGGCGGPVPLPDIVTVSSREVVVGEIQAVGRANPSP